MSAFEREHDRWLEYRPDNTSGPYCDRCDEPVVSDRWNYVGEDKVCWICEEELETESIEGEK